MSKPYQIESRRAMQRFEASLRENQEPAQLLLPSVEIAHRKEALRAGIWYGMVLVLSFLFSGFKGGADKLLGFSLLVLVAAVIGGACGLVLGLIGNRLQRNPR